MNCDLTLSERRRLLAQWVAQTITPHEARIRSWLLRRISIEEAEDLIQDAYCRIAILDSVDHIDRPEIYFFSIVKNLFLRQLKRQKIVPIELIAELDSYSDEFQPSPEAVAVSRGDYAKVLGMISRLPERCSQIVRLRKIEGWSQKEIADHLGTSEKAVEKQIWVGVKAIRSMWSTMNEEQPGQRVVRAEGGRREC